MQPRKKWHDLQMKLLMVCGVFLLASSAGAAARAVSGVGVLLGAMFRHGVGAGGWYVNYGLELQTSKYTTFGVSAANGSALIVQGAAPVVSVWATTDIYFQRIFSGASLRLGFGEEWTAGEWENKNQSGLSTIGLGRYSWFSAASRSRFSVGAGGQVVLRTAGISMYPMLVTDVGLVF